MPWFKCLSWNVLLEAEEKLFEINKMDSNVTWSWLQRFIDFIMTLLPSKQWRKSWWSFCCMFGFLLIRSIHWAHCICKYSTVKAREAYNLTALRLTYTTVAYLGKFNSNLHHNERSLFISRPNDLQLILTHNLWVWLDYKSCVIWLGLLCPCRL